MKSSDSINKTIYDELFPRVMGKAELRKLEILEAAIATYAELGINYISYEDIARRAKVSRPLINHHFPDKRKLFEMAIKFIRARFQEMAVNELQKHQSPEDKLKAYVRSTVMWTQTSPVHAKAWVFFFYVCISDAKLRNLHRELTTMGMERLVGLLKYVALEKGYSDKNLPEKAKNIQRIITGSLLELATEHDSKDSVASQQICEQTIFHCLHVCSQSWE